MTHNNEPTWTPWLPNPGTGECPVPEWAEGFKALYENASKTVGGDPKKVDWYGNHKHGDVTHYSYAVPADLAWLAENVSEWRGTKYVSVEDGATSWTSKPYNHGEYYTKDQWLRARRDLGYEQAEYPECPPNFRCIKQPNVGQSKYHRTIKGVSVDVYDILHAFEITNPGDQHAIKKMLQPGKRGYKDAKQDREEAIASLVRANELEGDV